MSSEGMAMVGSGTSHRRRRWWLGAVGAAGVLAGGGAGAQQDGDIEEGRRLFMEETFGGNGRTCATCHPPENNFTIDPAFIATLPGNDPLFLVGPSLRDLRSIEVRRLIREHGLILENVDGLDRPGVLRSVPHTLALPTSLAPRDDFPLTHATGWSGDGAPEDGSLRAFALGAVIQHFPKTPNRIEGVDFRRPTAKELDDLEAFQLSLGRQTEVNIDPEDADALVFSDDFVELGKDLFHGAPSLGGTRTRSCAGCHANAGANNASGDNRNFATGTNMLPGAPACLLGFVAPADGGFAPAPAEPAARAELCGGGSSGGPKATVTFLGDMTFNTPPLIEAADTPPFFHNNAAATIEAAVAFYTTDTFNDSLAGNGNAFDLDQDQIDAIAALLRALNVLENIASSLRAIEAVATVHTGARAAEELEVAISNTEDALQVLEGGPVELFPRLGVGGLIEEALALEREALDGGVDRALLDEAALALEEAAAAMVVSGSFPGL